jgi:rhodanese-related sulfurtransferase
MAIPAHSERKFPRWIWETLLLLLLTGIGAGATYYFHPNLPPFYLTQEVAPDGEISAEEARIEDAKSNVIWIDARMRKAYDKEHIPGALFLSQNESDFQDRIVPTMMAIQDGQEKLVIVYCDAKKCEASHHVAEFIRGSHPDPDKVRVLHGGWDAWKSLPP